MYITEILEIKQVDDETAYIKAIAEDFTLIYEQTLYDPPEYGPTIVETHIDLSDITDYENPDTKLKIPTEYFKDSVIEYLKAIDFDLNWSVVEYD